MEHGQLSLQEAAERVVHGVLSPGDGGIVGVSGDGSIAMVFNTTGMYRGAADSSGRFEVRIWE
jgi:beta-aspartyl-peptidase (threonine type)